MLETTPSFLTIKFLKGMSEKRENAGNLHFLLIAQHFILIIYDTFTLLPSIWTSVKFHRFVKNLRIHPLTLYSIDTHFDPSTTDSI